MITHRLRSVVQHCDRVLVFDHSELVEVCKQQKPTIVSNGFVLLGRLGGHPFCWKTNPVGFTICTTEVSDG